METCVLLANVIHLGKVAYNDERKSGLKSFAVHFAKESLVAAKHLRRLCEGPVHL
jgi:hypothetical protein